MTYLWIALGMVIGAGGYWLYDHFFSTAASVGRSLLARVEGDVAKAHKLITSL